MKRYLYVFALLSVLPWGHACVAQEVDSAKIISSLIRCWRARSHEFSPIYGLEDEEVKRYSKQKVCFTPDSISMYYGMLYTPKYSIKKVNSDNYSKVNFGFSKKMVNIFKDSLFEITISSMTKPDKKGAVHKMTDVVALVDETLYIVVDGVIFQLYDSNKKVEGRSAN